MAASHQWHDVADERDVREPFATIGGREIYLITLTQPAGTLQRAAALFFTLASVRGTHSRRRRTVALCPRHPHL
jgi:hypothetical protein